MSISLDESPPPDLRLRFKKRADAPAALTLLRADGTSTTGRIGAATGYGPVHDLAHYVVEQTLGLGDAFLGLSATGWTFADFERGAAARLPDAAVWAECWAGEISREVMAEQPLSAGAFNETVRAAASRTRPSAPPPPLTAEQLDVLRHDVGLLWASWRTLAPGGTLECPFYAGMRRTPTCTAI